MRNIWGTDTSHIDADEFCPWCEREVPHHYEGCPRDARMIPRDLYPPKPGAVIPQAWVRVVMRAG